MRPPLKFANKICLGIDPQAQQILQIFEKLLSIISNHCTSDIVRFENSPQRVSARIFVVVD